LRLGRTRRGVRRLESSEMEGAKEFGGRLFNAVFRGDVRGCLRSSLDEAQRTGSGLRIRLRLDAPELADVPWEYLYNPSVNRFLALSVETPVVRYLDLPERIQPLAIKPPLRMLVMISNPGGHLALDVEGEWRVLKEAVGDLERQGRVILERLGRGEASLPALQKQLRRKEYHVFHFIGHGAFDERAEDGVLLLEDENGQHRPVSGQFLGMLLHDERTLRLAILNSCEGARTLRTDPFAGTAQSLVQQGIPAVIAMQFEFSDTAAITLAHEFYYALADGYPVDAALAEARKAIFAQGNEAEWGTPVLYLRAPDGRIFDVEQVSEEERKHAQIVALHREAQMAMAQESWATAIEKWEAVLSLDPAHAEAEAGLSQVRQEQELATLYTKGREHYEAGRYREALDCLCQVDGIRRDYKDVGSFITAIEREFIEVIDRELGKSEALYREAQVAMTREGWATAIGKLEDVVGMEPANIEAAAALRQARQEHQLATLYDRGREHYEAGRWQEALDTLRRVQDMREDYRDVRALILATKRETARSRTLRLPQLPSIESRWLRIGLPVALAVIVLVLGGLFMAGAFSPPAITPTRSSTVTATEISQLGIAVGLTETPKRYGYPQPD
jgi:tetratricopeptide (TPR) repeat protein